MDLLIKAEILIGSICEQQNYSIKQLKTSCNISKTKLLLSHTNLLSIQIILLTQGILVIMSYLNSRKIVLD
jgi:hypothetical protein